MLTKVIPPAVLAMLLVACLVGARAESAPTPIWFGAVTGDAEKDTLAYPPVAQTVRPLILIGPARYVGAVTGVAEKDTFAFVEASPATLANVLP